MEIQEGSLTFRFSEGILAEKYDDWAFYRNQFNNVCGGAKAVDILVKDSQTVWLVEVKDYREHQRTKPSELGDEVAIKVRDTLAGLVAAKHNANNTIEKEMAATVLSARRLRIALHLEQPQNPSKLRPVSVDPADIQLKLKQLLKGVDFHPLVVDHTGLHPDMNWEVITE